MRLSNADYHHLVYDVRAYYIFLRLEKRRTKKRLKELEETIQEIEDHYKIKKNC